MSARAPQNKRMQPSRKRPVGLACNVNSRPAESKRSAGMPLMSDNIAVGFVVAGGFFLIDCVTWFFSSRRKTFNRTFVPREELFVWREHLT